MHGMKDGYNVVALNHAVRMIDLVDLSLINANGEFSELMQIYSP